ncbi:PepSY-associated TM helix domain-containing protein [Sphingobium sp. CR2-8]|uniref:PepSY-associated TM helix domain-containing protein n=1 Tax=Sphingobium sp. CR2-8 TaxID=1306534 RepID=UPI002DB92F08|nr:PepSY-associated TM helix domain-containing protein [Sphingobium sp. CR2-8]MEC3909748.1 PepSY-associated TM helix domain-containing protein [Sphingobium sp. CR2-8]
MQIPKSLTRAAMEGHGLLGVLFGAVIYVLCLTGSILVLVDQITIWERPDAPAIARLSDPDIAAISFRALTKAQAAGVAHDVYIQMPTDELPRMTVIGYGEKGDHRDWNVDAAGQLVPHAETPWLEFMQLLHFNLTLPGAIGRYIVGIFGTILLASIVTGLLAHRRIIKDAFRLRWGGSRRLTNADLHNRVGVWALPFHLIVALTGSLLGLAGLITIILAMVAYKGDQEKAIASLLGPQAGADTRAAPPPDIARMLRDIQLRAPGAAVTQLAIEHAGTIGQQVRIMVAAPRHLARNEAFLFNADGRFKWRAGLTDGNAGMRIYGMITPLHYGTYGGVALKIIYALLGMGLTLIVATGGNVWLARRREQGRATPRLERLWVALIWGQPTVIVAVALLTLLGQVPAVASYWMLTASCWAAALLTPTAGKAAASFRIALAIATVVTLFVHAALRGLANPVVLAADVILIAAIIGAMIKAGWRYQRAIPVLTT